FLQWVHAYEVDAETVRTIYATLGEVFPVVESWEVQLGNLFLTGRRQAAPDDLTRLATLVETEPYRSALALSWGVAGVEGLYSGFIADGRLAAALRDGERGRVNTDDRTLIEFEFARSVGRAGLFEAEDLFALAVARGNGRPPLAGGTVDWNLVGELRTVRALAEGRGTTARVKDPALQQRLLARDAYAHGDLRAAQEHWLAQDGGPRGPMDVTMLAESLSATADPRALPYIEQVRLLQPPEADALLARWKASAGEVGAAAEHLQAAFRGCRTFPWCYRPLLARSLDLAWQLTERRPDLGAALFEALAAPFAVRTLDGQRVSTYFSIGLATDFPGRCLAAFAAPAPRALPSRCSPASRPAAGRRRRAPRRRAPRPWPRRWPRAGRRSGRSGPPGAPAGRRRCGRRSARRGGAGRGRRGSRARRSRSACGGRPGWTGLSDRQ